MKRAQQEINIKNKAKDKAKEGNESLFNEFNTRMKKKISFYHRS